jgi:hypothetical protein
VATNSRIVKFNFVIQPPALFEGASISTDIRDKPTIDHDDVTALNFINSASPYVFRKHFRQGLRSHIMEILDPSAVARERSGTQVDGMRWFPRAAPRRMLRIFRSRLATLDSALEEIGRVKLVERYLAPDCMATSTECIVDYRGPDGFDLLLCGFQEVVRGEILDPWSLLDTHDLLPALHDTLGHRDKLTALSLPEWRGRIRRSAEDFIERIKHMVAEAGHIPDLAGVGNLFVTAGGGIRLVDINNICTVRFDASIHLDEKGYPVCDKSIEALSLIEKKLLGRPADTRERIYRWFLDPERRKAVKESESVFWEQPDLSAPKQAP